MAFLYFHLGRLTHACEAFSVMRVRKIAKCMGRWIQSWFVIAIKHYKIQKFNFSPFQLRRAAVRCIWALVSLTERSFRSYRISREEVGERHNNLYHDLKYSNQYKSQIFKKSEQSLKWWYEKKSVPKITNNQTATSYCNPISIKENYWESIDNNQDEISPATSNSLHGISVQTEDIMNSSSELHMKCFNSCRKWYF